MNRSAVRITLAVFAIACLTVAQFARAQAHDLDDRLVFAPPAAEGPETAEPRSPMMTALDTAGIGSTMDKLGLQASAYIEGSYSYNLNNPPASVNASRVFDFEHDAARMNQLSLTLEREIDPAAKRFDIGFRTQFLYGSDAGFIHSSGLFNYFKGPRSPINQPDLFQAYLTIAVPVGNGMRIAVGKFESIFGQEAVEPTLNTFYSHSFMFDYGLPKTNTGILAAYNIDSHWTAALGVSRGWSPDQSVNDNNGSPDVLGYIAYAPTELSSIQLNAIGGPEQNGNEGNYRYLFELMGSCTPTKNSPWHFALQGDYAIERHANVFDGQTESWYGATIYATYTLNRFLALSARGEWFHDQGGARIGMTGSVYEATLGASITPLPGNRWLNNLVIRPEVRYDYSDRAFFNSLSRHDQVTVALDAYLAL